MRHKHKIKRVRTRSPRVSSRRRLVRPRAGIIHCVKCKEGRLITLKRPTEDLTFCGFCGNEPIKR